MFSSGTPSALSRPFSGDIVVPLDSRIKAKHCIVQWPSDASGEQAELINRRALEQARGQGTLEMTINVARAGTLA